MTKLIALAALAVSLTGCVDLRVMDATVMSTKNMDIKKSLHRVDTKTRVQGLDERKMYVLTGCVPFPSIKEAVDRAIEQNPGCVGLSDVVIDYHERCIPLICAWRVYEASGNPVYEVDGLADEQAK